MPNQGVGATAGVPADQMIFLQQIGTMVQSAMQPFAHQMSVVMAHLRARVDMMQTELQAEILLGELRCSISISISHLRRKGFRTSL